MSDPRATAREATPLPHTSASWYMLFCVRTTLDLDEALVRAAKRRAAREGRTLTSLIEDGLRAVLAPPPPSPRAAVSLPTFGGDGPAPGVDLADPRSLRDAEYDEEDARLRAAAPDAAS